jgi:hypothetical protein
MRLKISTSLLLALVMPLMVACGFQQDSTTTHESVVDLGSFSFYVTEFQQKSVEYGSPVEITDLVVKFGPMTSALERGYCEMGAGKSPTIVIDENYWNNASEGARKSLLLHELGHCVLDRAHVSTLTNTGVPNSVMNPYTISANVFDYNEDHYWQELFSVRNTL